MGLLCSGNGEDVCQFWRDRFAPLSENGISGAHSSLLEGSLGLCFWGLIPTPTYSAPTSFGLANMWELTEKQNRKSIKQQVQAAAAGHFPQSEHGRHWKQPAFGGPEWLNSHNEPASVVLLLFVHTVMSQDTVIHSCVAGYVPNRTARVASQWNLLAELFRLRLMMPTPGTMALICHYICQGTYPCGKIRQCCGKNSPGRQPGTSGDRAWVGGQLKPRGLGSRLNSWVTFKSSWVSSCVRWQACLSQGHSCRHPMFTPCSKGRASSLFCICVNYGLE